MNYVYYAVDYSDSLAHHGIKGQKWGVRRFQNPDGTYTKEGRKRRGHAGSKDSRNLVKSTKDYINNAKAASHRLSKFKEENPELTNWDNGTPIAYKYATANRKEKKRLDSKLDSDTLKKVQEYKKLYDDFNESTVEGENGQSNAKWQKYYDDSKKYIDKYGHKKYQELLGDDANLYYTENWRTGKDDLIDYDSGNFYYRNLNEELW